MRHRIEELVGTSEGGMWIRTFHGTASTSSAAGASPDAGLPQDFQILDSEDQIRLIRRLIKAMNLDENSGRPNRAAGISMVKDEGLRPQHVESYGNPVEATAADLPCLSGSLRPCRGWWILPSCCCAHMNCVAQQTGDFTALPRPFYQYPRGRIPGHQQHPVRLGAHAGGDTGKVMIVG